MQVTGSWLAVSAGFLSATAGVFGKLAGTSAVALALAYYTILVLHLEGLNSWLIGSPRLDSFRRATVLPVASRHAPHSCGASAGHQGMPQQHSIHSEAQGVMTNGPVDVESAGHPMHATAGEWGIYNYKAVVAYDGTLYRGFQLQRGYNNNVPTVQGVLERVLCRIKQESRETLRMQCSGRTDSGVHAKGQVINFYSNKLTPDCNAMMFSLTRMLPDSIKVLSLERVPPDFHARYSALSKTYHYYVMIGKKVDPFTRWYRGRVQEPVNLHLMQEAAQLFVGQHDFTHFANVGEASQNPVKVITRFDVVADEEGYVFQVDGQGFLYKMVRHMVAALLTVGAGDLQAQDIMYKLQLGSAQPPGEEYRGWSVAPPEGLFLMKVTYPHFDESSTLCHPGGQHDVHGRPAVLTATSL